MRVVVVIPAHDEADRIERTVRAAASIPSVVEVIVVDDGSSDATADVAERAGATVVRSARNRGKGAALDEGVARAGDADVVLLLDADLGVTAIQGSRLLARVLRNEADMAVATFPKPPDKAGFGLVKGLARWGIARMGRGFDSAAPLSGQRALNRRALRAAGSFAAGYGAEVACTVRVLRAGLRVVEVPTLMQHAATGRDVAGFIHRGRQFVHVLRALARLALERPERDSS